MDFGGLKPDMEPFSPEKDALISYLENFKYTHHLRRIIRNYVMSPGDLTQIRLTADQHFELKKECAGKILTS